MDCERIRIFSESVVGSTSTLAPSSRSNDERARSFFWSSICVWREPRLTLGGGLSRRLLTLELVRGAHALRCSSWASGDVWGMISLSVKFYPVYYTLCGVVLPSANYAIATCGRDCLRCGCPGVVVVFRSLCAPCCLLRTAFLFLH